MRVKLLFVVGLALGYVLGSRAGRPRFEQLRAVALDVWHDPRVKKAISDTQDLVKENAPVVQAKVAEGVKTAVAGAQDVAGKVADTARSVSGKVTDAARDATEKVAETASKSRERIADRSESARDRLIISAATLRDSALESYPDDD